MYEFKKKKYKDVLLLAKNGYLSAWAAIQDAWDCMGSLARSCTFWQVKGVVWADVPKQYRDKRNNQSPVQNAKEPNKSAWQGVDIEKEYKKYFGKDE